jgi:hypothetical protein
MIIYPNKKAAQTEARSLQQRTGCSCRVIPYSAVRAERALFLVHQIAKMQLWTETVECTSQLDNTSDPQQSLDYLINQDAALETLIVKARELLAESIS